MQDSGFRIRDSGFLRFEDSGFSQGDSGGLGIESIGTLPSKTPTSGYNHVYGLPTLKTDGLTSP